MNPVPPGIDGRGAWLWGGGAAVVAVCSLIDWALDLDRNAARIGLLLSLALVALWSPGRRDAPPLPLGLGAVAAAGFWAAATVHLLIAR